MKRDFSKPMTRWRDLPAADASIEDRAATLVRESLAPGEPDALQLARIERRVRLPRARPAPARWLLRPAVVVLLVLGGMASVEAVQAARRAGWLQRIFPARRSPASSPTSSARRQVATKSARVSAPPPVDVPPASTPDENVPPSARARPRARTLARGPVVDGGDATAVAASEELRALDHAVGLLRRDHDAARALTALDAYLLEHPRSVLDHEARLARVDALLMLQRSDDALAALETLPLDRHRRSTELQLIRAELRARTDCARAELDFSAVLARSLQASLGERALYGRGACRAKRGDQRGASDDLRGYLERFPTGAHAAWARRWLESAEWQ